VRGGDDRLRRDQARTQGQAPLIAALLLALAVAAPPQHDLVLGGDHWRIKTAERGVIHVWRPAGYEARTAATIVYVHGYYVDADAAWTKHRLPEQFDASGKNALFIVAEAPGSSDDEVTWPSLGDLLRAVAEAGVARPYGPLIVVGHSAAYRTLVGWLDYPPVRHIFLLDALYGNEEDYIAWLEELRGHAGRRLTLVANDTTRWAEPFVKRLPYAQTAIKLPDSLDELPPLQRDARVLYVRSQYTHMDMVTGGKALPLILQRLRLKNVKPWVNGPLPAPPPAPGSP
jgi:hypothetical protein